MDKFTKMYVSFFVLTLVGFIAIGYFRPQQLTLANCLSLFYLFNFAIFFRWDVDNVVEAPLYGIPCWLVILAAIVGMLADVNFWLLPLIGVVTVIGYFLARGYLYNKDLNERALLKNAFYILAITYATMGLFHLIF